MTTSASGLTETPGALGRVTFLDGQGELPMLEITTAWSTAEIYLHGAHVTQFKKKDEAPLLFVSQCSRFTEGQPIRGGIGSLCGARTESRLAILANSAWFIRRILWAAAIL